MASNGVPVPGLAERPMNSVDLCVVDVETTGFRRTDRIIEIAVRRMRLDGTILIDYETLVNPGRSTNESTRIHGISDRHLVDAPNFSDVAGDLAEILNGSVWVAHNASFDSRFLAQEYGRLGAVLPLWPTLCTMRLSPLRGGPSRPSLSDCHLHFGRTAQQSAHRASGDVQTTSDILASMLGPIGDRAFRSLGVCESEEGMGQLPILNCGVAPTGKRHLREELRAEATIGEVGLSGTGAHEACLELYRGAVEAALEDRLLEAHELDGLLVLGTKLGVSPEQAVSINQSYFEGVASRAIADHRIDAIEKRDMEKVARILELDQDTVDLLLAKATPATSPSVNLEGMAVCFTGEVDATRKGRKLSRADLQASAAGRGMIVKSGVSRKLDLLVTADPYSMSGKSRKARELGVKIVSVESFITDLGIEVD
jgi:DNA polymerase III subunit epsilon